MCSTQGGAGANIDPAASGRLMSSGTFKRRSNADDDDSEVVAALREELNEMRDQEVSVNHSLRPGCRLIFIQRHTTYCGGDLRLVHLSGTPS